MPTTRLGRMRYAVLFVSSILMFLSFIYTPLAGALSGSDFQAGNIIDDTVFFNRGSMSTEQIQEFLNAKRPTCDTNGSVGPYYDRSGNRWDTRADYGRANGAAPPYTCLKSYSQSVPTITNSGSDLCKLSISGGTKSSAQIIYDVAQACSINSQTLLVLLEKEQSLVTDAWPWPIQYRSATGYGCPDTAPCDSEYYGFFNQVYQAAKAFKRYAANPQGYNYRAGRENNILYNPNASCGSSAVYIQNQATAGLYIYTPYRPNQAALNNLYGSGDGCSAYGNRNFWRLFSDWFGGTHQQWPSLNTPRWMQTNAAIAKHNVYAGTPTGDELPAGTHLKFVDKIFIDDTWYLRTEFDKANGQGKGIPQQYVTDIPYVNFSEPRYMMTTQVTKKTNPQTGTYDTTTFPAGTYAEFSRKTYVNGEWYYQTTFDAANNYWRTFRASQVSDIAFTDLYSPRYMIVKTGAKLVNLRTNDTISTYGADTRSMVVDKVYLNGSWYYRTQGSASNSEPHAILASSIEQEVHASDFDVPEITIRATQATTKFDLKRGTPMTDQPIAKGQIIRVAGKLTTNDGGIYYQTTYDKANNRQYGIPVGAVAAIAPSFRGLDQPREISTTTSVRKIDLLTGEFTGDPLPSGTPLYFTTKLEIDGAWYLRTQFDSNNNMPKVIPAAALGLDP